MSTKTFSNDIDINGKIQQGDFATSTGLITERKAGRVTLLTTIQGPTNVDATNLTFAGTHAATIKIIVEEVTGGGDLSEYFTIDVVLLGAGTYDLNVSSAGDVTGTTFTTTSGGILQYTTTTLLDTSPTRTLFYDVISNMETL